MVSLLTAGLLACRAGAPPSIGPEYFLEGPPDAERGPDDMGPDVMRPVAGRLGVNGPEFCLESGPEVFKFDLGLECTLGFAGSAFFERGPEFEFCRDAMED